MTTLSDTALAYIRAGLSVIPTGTNKRPVIDEWTSFMKAIAPEEKIKEWFSSNSRNIALIGGAVSGGLEIIDFDFQAEALAEWSQEVQERQPGLLERLVIEKSPHGAHVLYRCASEIPGNTKLASRGIEVPGPGEHEYRGKKFKAQAVNGKYFIVPELIETRGSGGYCLVYPSRGYELKQGSFLDIPTIAEDERETLIESARACNQWLPPQPMQAGHGDTRNSKPGEKLPGQDFDERGDVRAVLKKHGWTYAGNGNDGREKWLRPGKSKGHSATLTDGKIFYPFSSNAYPFESYKAYGPFGVYTILEHGGDFTAAARALSGQGYGSKPGKPIPKGRSLMELKKKFSARISWLWRQHFAKGMPVMVNGREGTGKTSICLVSAKEILERYNRGSIVWLATEGAVLDTVNKMETIGLDDERFVVAEKGDGTFKFDFTNPRDLKELDDLLGTLPQPILAVFIDSIRGMCSLGDNDDKNGHIMHKVNAIVCDKHGAACIYLDHHKKGRADTLLDKSVGTTAKTAAVRQILSVTQTSAYTRKIEAAKSNISVNVPILKSIFTGTGIVIREDAEQTDATQLTKVEEWLIGVFADSEEVFASDIYDDGKTMGFPESVIRKAKTKLGIGHKRTDGRSVWVSPYKNVNSRTVGTVEYKNDEESNTYEKDYCSDLLFKEATVQTVQGVQTVLQKNSLNSNKNIHNNNNLNAFREKHIKGTPKSIDPDIENLDLDNLPMEGFLL